MEHNSPEDSVSCLKARVQDIWLLDEQGNKKSKAGGRTKTQSMKRLSTQRHRKSQNQHPKTKVYYVVSEINRP